MRGGECTNPLLPLQDSEKPRLRVGMHHTAHQWSRTQQAYRQSLPRLPWFDLSSHPEGSYLEATDERGEKELRGNHPGPKAHSYVKSLSGGGGRPPTYLTHCSPSLLLHSSPCINSDGGSKFSCLPFEGSSKPMI